jgi:hypothetical protein
MMINESEAGGGIRGSQKKKKTCTSTTYLQQNFPLLGPRSNPVRCSSNPESITAVIWGEKYKLRSSSLYLHCIHYVYSVLYCLCSFICSVLFEHGVLFCVMCVICVLCLTVVSLPPGKPPFSFKINNNNNFIHHITSSILDLNTFLGNFPLNILNLRYSLNERDWVPHPYIKLLNLIT